MTKLVAVLKARFIMVLGHTSCGAVSAAISAYQKDTAFPGHIQSIATALKPAVAAAAKSQKGGDLMDATTLMTNIHSRSATTFLTARAHGLQSAIY